MTRKIPLWEVQQKIDERNFDYYPNLPIEEKKQISLYPLVTMIAATESSPDIQKYYLLMVNSMVNSNFWNISKHPDLQWKLLAGCGIGFKQKHKWIPLGKRKTITPKLDEFLFEINPLMNYEELEIVKSKLTKEKLIELTRGRGISDKDAKIYIEEFKKFTK